VIREYHLNKGNKTMNKNNIILSCDVDMQLSTHYLIYKIINTINGKYYIGQH
jgi:hypothetical protein